MGFISENPNSTGAPDPYWIINENNLVVSEDKIYEEKEQVKKYRYLMLARLEDIKHGLLNTRKE